MKRHHFNNEALVSHEFYYQSRLRDWNLQMEVKMRSQHHRSGYMRADCVVYVEKRKICAVEFKRDGKLEPAANTRQAKAYADIAIPTVYCLGWQDIGRAIGEVEDLIHERLAA